MMIPMNSPPGRATPWQPRAGGPRANARQLGKAKRESPEAAGQAKPASAISFGESRFSKAIRAAGLSSGLHPHGPQQKCREVRERLLLALDRFMAGPLALDRL